MRRNTATDEPRLVPVEEAALRKGCSPTTIWRAAAKGLLTRHWLLGRTVFDAAEVDALHLGRTAVSRDAA